MPVSKSFLIKGSDFQRFYTDNDVWGFDTFHDEFLIEVNGQVVDLVAMNTVDAKSTSDDFVNNLTVDDAVCILSGDIQKSLPSPDEKLEAADTLDKWVQDNSVVVYITRNMNGFHAGRMNVKIKQVAENIEGSDISEKEGSLKALNSVSLRVKRVQKYIGEISLNAEEMKLINDRIVGTGFKRAKQYITNYHIMGDHVIVEVFDEASGTDYPVEYWPFSRETLKSGGTGHLSICESIDEAMLVLLTTKYDENDRALPYIGRMIGMYK